MSILELSFASGDSSLSVRRFTVHESISGLFTVSIVARSPNDDIDLASIVGHPAMFRVVSGVAWVHVDTRLWTGVCSEMELVRTEPTGLSTYALTIVPNLWMLTQRKNHRLFLHRSIPEIVTTILDEWKVRHAFKIERSLYPKLELRVQYGESDHAFVSRMLEEAGIAFYFEDDVVDGSQLVLSDRPHTSEPRHAPPIAFVDDPGQAQTAEREYVTDLHLGHKVRPGRLTIRDFDFRRPGFALFGESIADLGIEARMEQYQYMPGAFLTEGHQGGETPYADDKGVARSHPPAGQRLAQQQLEAQRATKQVVSFKTNVLDLSPGVVFTITGHPRRDLAVDKRLLVTSFVFEGELGHEWSTQVTAAFAAVPHRPAMTTPKPRIHGVQSAIVVGPAKETVHTDEFGRVRVQFHWDREGGFDENSMCWIRVSQGWAGPGYGLINLPRVGHEVLVGFLDGDPDNPIVVGRVFNGAMQVPVKLPDGKLISAWKTDSHSNIILFVDIPNHEGFLEQAELDRLGVVKRDLLDVIGRDKTYAVRADEQSAVGGKYSQGVVGDIQVVTGGEYSVISQTTLSQTAGLELTMTSGFKWEAGVTPLLPVVMAILAVNVVKGKLEAAFPAGPPDLMAILQAQAAALGLNLSGGQLPPGVSWVPAIPDTAEAQIQQLISDFKGAFTSILQPILKLLSGLSFPALQALLKLIANAPNLQAVLNLLNGALPPPGPGQPSLSSLMTDLSNLFDSLMSSIPSTTPEPGGSASSEGSDAAEQALEKLQPVLMVFSEIMDEIAPGTSIRIEPTQIRITTGKATIELNGEDIEIKANGSIKIEGQSVSISPSPCKCGG
jgi:type VI secretion system secreted protein VgrG